MNSRALAVQLAMLGLAFLGLAAFETVTRSTVPGAEFGFYGTYATPLLFAVLGSFVLLIAGIVAGQIASEAPQRVETSAVAAPRSDPRAQSRLGARKAAQPEAPLQFHPFNEVAYKHYLAGLKAPPKERKVKITDAVAAIAEGRNPVVLAEFLAAQLAIASSDDSEAYLKSRLPHLEKPVSFRHRSIKGLAFIFEGKAFVVLAGRENETLWNRVRETTALRTGRHQNVPGETVWDAAPRHRGFAEDWDALREAVEAWVKDVALKSDPERAFIFSGYAQGGALATLAAYEFGKRGRNVAGVVTFASPHAGGKAFAGEYDRLGLDERTLRIESAAAPGRIVQPPFIYAPVGRVWRVDKIPLLSLDLPPIDTTGKRPVAGPHGAMSELMSDYVLPMTVRSYQRLRELGGGQGTAAEFDACYAALSDHLSHIRGSTPDEPLEIFVSLKGLPIKIADKSGLEALKAKFPNSLI